MISHDLTDSGSQTLRDGSNVLDPHRRCHRRLNHGFDLFVVVHRAAGGGGTRHQPSSPLERRGNPLCRRHIAPVSTDCLYRIEIGSTPSFRIELQRVEARRCGRPAGRVFPHHPGHQPPHARVHSVQELGRGATPTQVGVLEDAGTVREELGEHAAGGEDVHRGGGTASGACGAHGALDKPFGGERATATAGGVVVHAKRVRIVQREVRRLVARGKVDEMHPTPRGQHDVLGLDVAVAHAGGVNLAESSEKLPRDPGLFREGRRRPAGDPLGQRPVKVLSHNVECLWGVNHDLIGPHVRMLRRRGRGRGASGRLEAILERLKGREHRGVDDIARRGLDDNGRGVGEAQGGVRGEEVDPGKVWRWGGLNAARRVAHAGGGGVHVMI